MLSVCQLVLVATALSVAGRARSRAERALHLAGAGRAAPLRWRTAGAGPRVAVVVTAAVLVAIALPLVTLVVRSLRTGSQTGSGWGLDHYVALGSVGPGLSVTVWQAAASSLRAAVDATVLAVLVGGLVALVVSRRPRGRGGRRAVRLLDAVFMLPLGVSAVTVGFGILLTFDRPLGLPVDLRTGGLLVPLAQAVVAVPLVVRTVLPVLRAIDPRLREAAAALGASPARVLAAVDVPVAARAAGLAVGFAFAVSLGEFGATSFLARPDNPTLPVVIFRLIGRPGAESAGMALAACVVLAAMTAAVIALAERLRAPGQGGLL